MLPYTPLFSFMRQISTFDEVVTLECSQIAALFRISFKNCSLLILKSSEFIYYDDGNGELLFKRRTVTCALLLPIRRYDGSTTYKGS